MGRQRDTSVQSHSKFRLKVLGSSSMVLPHCRADSWMIFVKLEGEQWFSSYLVIHWAGLSPSRKTQDFEQHRIGLPSGIFLLLSGILYHWGQVMTIGYVSGMQLCHNSSRRIRSLLFGLRVWKNIWTKWTLKFWIWSRCMHLMTLRFGFKIVQHWRVCTKHFLTGKGMPKTSVHQVNPQMQSSCMRRIQQSAGLRSD